MKKWILIVILFMFSLVCFLNACGEGGTDTGNPGNQDDGEGDDGGDDMDDPIGQEDDPSQIICEEAGGEWISFDDSCAADLCPEQLEAADCESPPESGFDCECGEDQCWNDETTECEDI